MVNLIERLEGKHVDLNSWDVSDAQRPHNVASYKENIEYYEDSSSRSDHLAGTVTQQSCNMRCE